MLLQPNLRESWPTGLAHPTNLFVPSPTLRPGFTLFATRNVSGLRKNGAAARQATVTAIVLSLLLMLPPAFVLSGDTAPGKLPVTSAANGEQGEESVTRAASSIIWDKERQGWQVGAKLVSATGRLQPGDPIVVQFLLRNVSENEQTVVLQQYDDIFPVLGEDNRINLNISAGGQRRYQHVLAPDEVLNKRQYRVTVSTEGLLPGQYFVTAQPAFWQAKADDPNSSTGIGRQAPIPLTLGDPDSIAFAAPPQDDNPKTEFHWGKPVAGLIVGMRLPEGRSHWPTESRMEAELAIRNVSDQPIELEYEIPQVGDWNMNVESKNGDYVRLDWTWFSGIQPRVTRSFTVAPNEQVRLTGIEAEVQVGGLGPVASETRKIEGPTLQILSEKTEFKYGDPKRLIATQGSYSWAAWITVRQQQVTDLDMVIGSRPVPFEIESK